MSSTPPRRSGTCKFCCVAHVFRCRARVERKKGAEIDGRSLASRAVMATHITEDCINCGACLPECPNDAIAEGDSVYVIDPKLCTECVGFNEKEACQAVCPVECCLPDANHAETEAALVARAVALHPGELDEAVAAGTFPSRFHASK